MTGPLPTVACKRCGRQIAWVRTDKGHPMPLDPEPNEAGNVFVVKLPTGSTLAAVASKKQPRPPGVAFVPHFATCPELNRGRKRAAAPKPAKPPPPEPPPTLDLGGSP